MSHLELEILTDTGSMNSKNPSKDDSLTYFHTLLLLLHLVARHMFGYRKVLDGDSDPLRPDHYND